MNCFCGPVDITSKQIVRQCRITDLLKYKISKIFIRSSLQLLGFTKSKLLEPIFLKMALNYKNYLMRRNYLKNSL